MKKMTAAMASEMSGTALHGSPDENTFESVVTDSRKAAPGTLFIGLRGERGDGSDYAESAYECGCRVMLLNGSTLVSGFIQKHPDVSVMTTDDTYPAMHSLARNYLAGLSAKKLAITGSTGKTTTKEMAYAVMSSKYRTVCNRENFNNHIGVPVTAFTVEEDTEIAIFEMGMNHTGEIRPLAEIVRPQTAAITNIGIAHIGLLGSRENIFREKMDITSFMDKNCTLIYNPDNDLLQQVSEMKTLYTKFPAGENAGSRGLTISDVTDSGEQGISFNLTYHGETQRFELSAPGVHNAWNASVAVAFGLKYGISLAESAQALRSFRNTAQRLEIIESDGLKLIDDTYNANPEAAVAAIGVLAGVSGKRHVLVLADMLELGDETERYHRETLQKAVDKGIDLIIAVGEVTGNAAKKLDDGQYDCISYRNTEEFIEHAHEVLRKGDAVLVKGSHRMQIDRAAAYIRENGGWR